MRTEVRFVLAIILMVGVLVVTNILFPPIPTEVVEEGGERAVPSEVVGEPPPPAPEIRGEEERREGTPADPEETEPLEEGVQERQVVVEGPLYRFTFTTSGARLESAQLLRFRSFAREGPVELVEPGTGGALGSRILTGAETVDLSRAHFEPSADDLKLASGDGPQSLTFTHRPGQGSRGLEVTYTFDPESYVVRVQGRTLGGGGTTLLYDLGTGLAFNESREQDEARSRAYAVNHLRQGVRSRDLSRVRNTEVEDGPFYWVAFRSRYFVLAMMGGSGAPDEAPAYVGGLTATELPGEAEVAVTVTQPLTAEGTFAYRLFLGPQDYSRLSALGNDLQEVNAYGWRFIRPILRPFVGIITTVLVWLHEALSLGYGMVLVLFGVLMRVLLWPLNQKAMRAQFRNMAVQPLLQDIQKRYKDQPERMQKELMKLYKEHGFNPLAGCLPLLLPWPVLIALFFVFQNTIELRGVPFLWLPDLSAPDPYFALPVFLGLSMFLLQWVSMRTLETVNPQMKMMMWFMPIFMVFIFFNLASGLNLYYAVSNIATLPQQWWIARERGKVQVKQPEPQPGD